MPEDIQPSLFPDQQPPQNEVSEAELSERIAHIGKHARPYEPVDRTSEAAKDQGWGSQKTASIDQGQEATEERQPVRQQNRHPEGKKIELPGKIRGRSNTPGLATKKEVQTGKSSKEIDRQNAINSRGAAVARQILKNSISRPGT